MGKTVFIQFQELLGKVPRIALVQLSTNLNCDYANLLADCKNVYLSQSLVESENIFYSYAVDKCFDIFDCSQVKECTQCYENIDCMRNNNSKFLFRSRECIDSSFLFDCVNCHHCFMSNNLRNKQFVIRNEQYSREEYETKMKEIHPECYQDLINLKSEFLSFIKNGIHRFANLVKTTFCTGDNISNAKNVRFSFDVPTGENLKFCVRTVNLKDSWDVTGGITGELVYETAVAGHEGNLLRFVSNADILREVEYSDWCKNSSNLFGCAGVKNRQYCILNKQYVKDKYEKLRAHIIEQMKGMPYVDPKGNKYDYGEFFPPQLSPFAYNESMAYEHIPLSKTEVLARGLAWRDPDPSPYIPTITAKDLPNDIQNTADSITKEIISCSSCPRVYRILQTELTFLKRQGVALPRKCQECRHKDRFAFRNPLKLWHRKCMKKGCSIEFETAYTPDRPEKVYCERCYQQEVY